MNLNSVQENIQHRWTLESKLLKQKRRSRRAEVREVYECECGKNYLSFPALYLHARVKHNSKLTSKPEGSKYKTFKFPHLTKYIYLLQNENNPNFQHQNQGQHASIQPQNGLKQKVEANTIKQTQRKNFIQELVEKYCQQLDSREPREVICKFLQAVFKQSSSEAQTPQETLSESPYYLNQYVSKASLATEGIQSNSQGWKNICSQLLAFCKWLKEHNHTNLIVLYDTK